MFLNALNVLRQVSIDLFNAFQRQKFGSGGCNCSTQILLQFCVETIPKKTTFPYIHIHIYIYICVHILVSFTSHPVQPSHISFSTRCCQGYIFAIMWLRWLIMTQPVMALSGNESRAEVPVYDHFWLPI